MKQFVASITGCSLSNLEKEEFKQRVIGPEWESKIHNTSETFGTSTLTYRKMLQHLGTEVARHIHPNFHINGLFADITGMSRWIVTDCRFFNEAESIKKRGGIIVRIVNRKQQKVIDEEGYEIWRSMQHSSETSLDHYIFDHVIENSGDDINQLKAQVELLISKYEL